MQLEQQLSKAIQDAAGTYSDQIQIELEQPAQLIHGDYSTNVAMKLARVAKKNPFEIAMDLKAQLEKKELPINQVDVVRPGFINFFYRLGSNSIK